jgi:hypothetical protein
VWDSFQCIIVYLGPKLPAYVLDNLGYLRKEFPQLNLVFISDNPKSAQKVEKINVRTWLCPNSIELWPDLRNQILHPMNFRNGFWFSTTARFKAIELYMEKNPLPVLHVESDVWISPTFPFAEFLSLTELAFPMETTRTGAASIVWIPDLKKISQLTEFVMRCISKDPNETDMTILGKLAQSKVQKVYTLPTQHSDLLSNSPEESARFRGLFDPLTYGIYLLGEDSRNKRGIRTYNKTPLDHLVKPQDCTFEFLDGELYVTQSEKKYALYCLHNHAKDRSLFIKTESMLGKNISNIRSSPWNGFQFSIFFIQLLESIIRRIKS